LASLAPLITRITLTFRKVSSLDGVSQKLIDRSKSKSLRVKRPVRISSWDTNPTSLPRPLWGRSRPHSTNMADEQPTEEPPAYEQLANEQLANEQRAHGQNAQKEPAAYDKEPAFE
jgi:hypothetical protein